MHDPCGEVRAAPRVSDVSGTAGYQLHDPKKRAIYGQCEKVPWERRKFCGGGSGVLAPTHLLAAMMPKWPMTGNDDVKFSELAEDMGAPLNNIAGFNPGCNRPYASSITLHHCIG